MRILRATAHTILSPTFVGTDEETPTAATGTPTCAVAREDGTALTAATVSAVSGEPGVYSAAITTTHTSRLDVLTLTWVGTVTGQQQTYVQTVEVVGAHYCTLPEIRGRRDLEDTRKYPTTELKRVRDAWADRIEDAAGVAFVPRYHRDTIDGDGSCRLALSQILPTALIAVTIDGVAQSLTGFTLDDAGAIRTTSVFPYSSTPRNIEVQYEHGYPACPGDIREEYVKAVRGELLGNYRSAPNDALSTTVDGVTVRFGTPNPAEGRPTGIMGLDAVIVGNHNYRAPAVA